MKGLVLDYSVQTNSGVISGDDGNRYTFAGQEWREQRVPARGMHVDFAVMEGSSEASAIYLSAGTAPSTAAFGVSAAGKDRTVAGILGILLGGLGIHKFYLGYTKAGIIMLALFIIGAILAIVIIGIFILIAVSAIGLAEGIIYLTKSDQEFESTYVTGQKEWF